MALRLLLLMAIMLSQSMALPTPGLQGSTLWAKWILAEIHYDRQVAEGLQFPLAWQSMELGVYLFRAARLPTHTQTRLTLQYLIAAATHCRARRGFSRRA